MRVLYIYRHPDMGFSIGRVFKPIERNMLKHCEVESICMPVANYKPKGLWRNIKAARATVKAKQYDIVHITGAEHYLIPFLKGQRVVVTVHDLGFFTNHKWTIRAWWKYLWWILVLKIADRIAFISEKSKLEALSLVDLNKNHLQVVYDALSPDFTFSPKIPNLECPVLLHIGTKPNKNLKNTILAIKDFKCKLRIVGKISDDYKYLLQLYNIDYSSAEKLTDSQIIEEYKSCDIVSFPSFYEGFGMPIIEGQAIGRPVLTSNLAPMDDVAGGAAVLVNPADVDSIRNGYLEVMRNWNRLVEKGQNNIKRFSLEVITKQYYQLYNSIID